MINATNKKIAFFLSLLLSIISWVILFFNIILKITTLTQVGLYGINTFSFAFVTILLSIYTFYIIFKLSNVAYFPVLLMIFHISALNASTLAIFYIIIDLILLLILNTGTAINHNENKPRYTTKTAPSASRVNNDNVFDAEFHTKED